MTEGERQSEIVRTVGQVVGGVALSVLVLVLAAALLVSVGYLFGLGFHYANR